MPSSEVDKKRGRPKRVELPDVNINTGAQNTNTERASNSNLSPERNDVKSARTWSVSEQQATSNKQQATSNKQQATSNK